MLSEDYALIYSINRSSIYPLRYALGVLTFGAFFFALTLVAEIDAILRNKQEIGYIDHVSWTYLMSSVSFHTIEENQMHRFSNIKFFSGTSLKDGSIVYVLRGRLYCFVKDLLFEMSCYSMFGFIYCSWSCQLCIRKMRRIKAKVVGT